MYSLGQGWVAITVHRLSHWYWIHLSFITMGKLPFYICTLMAQRSDCSYKMWFYCLFYAQGLNWGRNGFTVPCSWNSLQKHLKLRDLVSLLVFEALISTMVNVISVILYLKVYLLFLVVYCCVLYNFLSCLLGQVS